MSSDGEGVMARERHVRLPGWTKQVGALPSECTSTMTSNVLFPLLNSWKTKWCLRSRLDFSFEERSAALSQNRGLFSLISFPDVQRPGRNSQTQPDQTFWERKSGCRECRPAILAARTKQTGIKTRARLCLFGSCHSSGLKSSIKSLMSGEFYQPLQSDVWPGCYV